MNTLRDSDRNLQQKQKDKKRASKKRSEKFIDVELNSLNYEDALKFDKRNYLQYYISLLLTKHILIFTFIQVNDYNSQIIKIYIFFFTFAINFTISAMFYSDNTMNKIYNDNGSFDFTYQLPQMLYSFLISSVLKKILNYFGLYEENILKIKQCEDKEKKILIEKESRYIKIKIIIFFIITYIVLFFMWIYLGCFCAVYKKIQIHLLFDVLSSFGFSFIIPIFVNLLPGMLRIPALRSPEKNKKYLYKLSGYVAII